MRRLAPRAARRTKNDRLGKAGAASGVKSGLNPGLDVGKPELSVGVDGVKPVGTLSSTGGGVNGKGTAEPAIYH